MAHKSDWLFKLPAATRHTLAETVLGCFKTFGITQKEFRKLGKTAPKKAEKMKKKLAACMMKKLKRK